MDYTVLVDLRAFEALVDAVGGVDFYIPIDMDYEDPYQDLSIHFSKGMRHLNGAEALKVVRCRNGYASQDIGRMQTQQDFLKAVAQKMLTPASLTRLDDYCKIFVEYVDTDLNVGNLVWLGGQRRRHGGGEYPLRHLARGVEVPLYLPQPGGGPGHGEPVPKPLHRGPHSGGFEPFDLGPV